MLAQAAISMGLQVHILERKDNAPALRLASSQIIGDWDDPACLLELASRVDVITLENEFVAASALRQLESAGYLLFPSAESMRLVQDKLIQKQTLVAAGLSVARFYSVQNRAEVVSAAGECGWPLLLKARCNGYDGKGNVLVQNEAGIMSAWQSLNGDENPLYVEEYCPFDCELATIITTARDHTQVHYPLVRSVQQDHICHTIHAPAPVAEGIITQALKTARAAVNAVQAVGSFGVEMFLCQDGNVLINELAPRVHNSGHYSIEACVCSQFENHLRAICGWPLGSVDMVKPAAVMVNLLGQGTANTTAQDIAQVLTVPTVHLQPLQQRTVLTETKNGAYYRTR